MAFIEEILCANMQLATNLDNSEDHKFVVITLSFGTQFS